MHLEDSVLVPIGMPRNDIFFNKSLMEDLNKSIREQYGIQENSFVILYAPTYRGEEKKASFNSVLEIKKIKTILNDFYKDKKVVFAYRGHYYVDNSPLSDIDLDWSNAPYMQDLLCCADLLITDYSSCMWDFSLTYKPCILFTPDIDTYLKERGFYTEPETWGFPICKNTDEVINSIKTLDYNQLKNSYNQNHQYFNSYETGHAAEKICDIILKEI